MKLRIANALLALLFAVGVVAYPAWHRAQCASAGGAPAVAQTAAGGTVEHTGGSHHDADRCPVCHLANTPLAGMDIAAAVVFTPSPGTAAPAVDFLAPIPPRHVLPFACGPPARA